MVNYLYATDEQKELANNARKIMEDMLLPRIDELEAADGGKGIYPMDVHQALADAGYYAMYISEEWGGLGLDPVTQGVVLEEMGKIDAGFTFSFAGSGSYFNQILLSEMSKAEKQMWADRILSGTMGTLAMTEPGAGSDAAAMRTTAVKDGNEWVINGTKCFCSHSTNAEYFLVPAWTDKTQRASKGVTTFFVEKERGVKVGKKENKMGIRLSPTSEVVLEDVRVPAKNMVGPEGEGFKIFMRSLGRSRPLVMSIGVGIAQRALDLATDYAKTRKTFGKPIIENQGVSFLLADMEIQIQAARNLVLYAARCMDVGADITSASACAKAFASDTAMKVTTDAVQVFGGYGYSREYPVEKLMRDAKIFSIFEGTNQIQRVILSGYLKKQH